MERLNPKQLKGLRYFNYDVVLYCITAVPCKLPAHWYSMRLQNAALATVLIRYRKDRPPFPLPWKGLYSRYLRFHLAAWPLGLIPHVPSPMSQATKVASRFHFRNLCPSTVYSLFSLSPQFCCIHIIPFTISCLFRSLLKAAISTTLQTQSSSPYPVLY